MLFVTGQHLQGEEKENKSAGITVKQQLNQKDKAVEIAPAQKRKSKSESVHVASDEEAGPSQPMKRWSQR